MVALTGEQVQSFWQYVLLLLQQAPQLLSQV
jgi:hypothetical protein